MSRKTLGFIAVFILTTTIASAVDFGAHAGYYANDVKKPYVGVDLMVPIGMLAISPNVDYWKSHGVGYWLAGADLDVRIPHPGASFCGGAGPTYCFLTNYKYGQTTDVTSGIQQLNIGGLQYNPNPPGGTNPSTNGRAGYRPVHRRRNTGGGCVNS